MSWDTLLYITVGILLVTLTLDIFPPKFLKEGFMVDVGDNPFLTGYFPRRGDETWTLETFSENRVMCS